MNTCAACSKSIDLAHTAGVDESIQCVDCRSELLDVLQRVPTLVIGDVWQAACEEAQLCCTSITAALLRKHASRIIAAYVERFDRKLESDLRQRWMSLGSQ